ncbi:ubiquitin-protein ligase [Lithospermum erythrorhizon]|uniref:HECT-type E3 ubiquitin transferase n=1 Tax=Lithospermum erythrorhizon TaxID=34254 RepID=A0AAV3PSD9_LITER
MATIRSSLPSRLRQLLSSENNIGPSIKIDSETAPRVKAFIDKVIQCPLQDIAIPLSGFHWEYGKGNFHHWRPLFLHFDTYFKTYLSNRNDLCLSDDILGDTAPFPKQTVCQILRVLQIILENCPNKSSFSGLEHFRLLLASTDPEILIAALETLAALVKIIPSKLHASGKLVGCGVVNSCLLSLAQGWGSKEEGLGLYSCVVANEKTQDEGLCLFPSDAQNDCGKMQNRLGSTLYFEVHDVSSQSHTDANAGKELSSIKVINMPDVHLYKEDDLSLMKLCMEEHNVPSENRFSLMSRIRFAHAFRSSRICRLYSKVCLLAFIVLVQSSDSHDELVSFFSNEPEYTNDLIRIARSEEPISASIRTLAMNALGAQLAAYASSNERARILGSSMSFGGGNRMVLLNVLQKAILSLKNSSDASSVSFTEALLQFYLLHVLSSSTSGSVIRGSGMVPTFLPLLEDSDPMHIHLVCLAVKTLQKLMDYSNAAVSLFKELGGVELLTQRLEIEVHRVIDSSRAEGEASISAGQSSRYSDGQIHNQKRLIRALLKALGSATYAPANSTRAQNSQDVALPVTLTLIFRNVEKFGGDVYSSAVTLMSEIIHKDPTCFQSLHDVGLPNAFLSSVVAGVLPSSKAITCVPNGLGAVCLNTKGLDAVRETSSLSFLVNIFTDKKYIVALNDGIVPLANAVEELLRHVSSLRGSGVDFIIEIINRIATLGEAKDTDSSGKPGSSGMEMEIDQKDNDVSRLVGSADSAVEAVTNDQFIQLCIFHVMVLVQRAMENAETCRLFVEKSGIESLLKLLLRPTISQSSEGMSIALHSTMVFKAFTQHHSAPLARAFCFSLRDHLKKALSGFSNTSESFLLDPKVSPDSGVFSSLFLVEFLLFLAASKDSRWVNALLAEFGSGSKDVLEDIGRIHREVMWQISLLEDAKVEDESPAASESQQSELADDDTDEQRFNSFRQLLDPLLRRRMSGWSFESQFFDLINLYRDLSRTSSPQNRFSVDGSSDQTSGLMPSDGPSTSMPKDADKRRSYYHSCCDMVRSLSIHITYLFQELGKSMLLPSRRRDDLLNVTASAKSVASTFASITLDHINLKDRASSSASEAAVSTKCRYFGKVIDFIDGILLDKPDLFNPVLLNCLYGHGVIHSVMTTFQATSQLHFAVNRTPASPMDTDEASVRQEKLEGTDSSWIYGPLACYGKLMDHLVTSSLILSPFTKHLLTQPLVSGGDIPFPRDPETFVKVLQSMVLKAVIPLWSHPQFTECNHEVIATILSIMKHIYSGVEVKNVNSISARVSGPPPNESTISTIVEMGFSRPRAEEALRQVGSNSVELAMEWLFSHPEEVQEDDELARALAMSLGNSDSDTKEDGSSCDRPTIEEAAVQPPPVEDLLSTCKKLLQMKDSLAFPVRDLLLMICSQNDGQYRSIVISFIIEQVKLCSDIGESGNMNILSSFFHVLALILNEDAAAREVASKCGLVKVVIDLLSVWNSCSYDREASQVPKWVTAAFIVIDRLAQVGQKLNADLSELLGKDESADQNSNFIDEAEQNKLQELLGLSAKHLDLQEQMQLIEIACNCISKSLPSETMHAVLQICSTLTRTHSVAVKFLDDGGLRSLLSLPTSSLFIGFDNVAATIIRHILEDPQTLQLAMESEIRHSVVMASNRQPTGRLTARSFLLNLTSVIQRDPVIFMQAARSVCQVEMVGDRPYIVLLKDRDKDKNKEKEKEKEKAEDKQQSNDVKTVVAHPSPLVPGSGLAKPPDASFKNVKANKKPPPCFTTVIELLLDSIVTFVPPSRDEMQREQSSKDMDIDSSGLKGKGKAVASAAVCDESIKQDSSAPMVRVVFILKLLTESLLMYASSIHVVLRRDAEISSFRGGPQRSPVGQFAGGIFHHILHKFLPYPRSSKKERKADVDWRQKLASKAGQFLVASCVRSTEARKRIFTEISAVFNGFVESCKGFRAPGIEIQAFIDLLNDVLAARSPTGSYISAEASVTFIDVGLVRCLTRALHVLDLDNADSSKVATGVVKVLEVVTKEHVHAVELNAAKSENSAKPSDPNRRGTNIGADVSQPLESMPQTDVNSVSAEPFITVQSFGGSEAVTDDMEHDQDIDGGFAPPSEDDYMHDNSEDSRALENSLNSGGIRFEIQPDAQQNIDEEDEDDDEDDDDDMSGDEGDDVDEDEGDDHNGLEEEDEMHHLPHPDTDQDDNDMEEDEFDEEVMEGEDEEDEDEEDGVILRLGEGMNGINVFDHIEVLGREHSLNSETLHVMPVEVFGSRRQGRTTSIYNLLGRGGESTAPTVHPLLQEPSMSLQSGSARRAEISRDSHADRNAEPTSSRLESVFRSLRNGRHGHRLNIWASDQHSGGSTSGSSIPQGLEDLLVSNLRRPTPERPPDNVLTADPEEKGEALQNTDSITMEPVTQVENENGVERSVVSPPATTLEASVSFDVTPTETNTLQGRDASTQQNETSEMQFEQNDVVRDVEAVSQESSGSGATLGESLRSLDVEIGSADGHDESGERHLAGENRTRRANVSLGNSVSGSGRDPSLHSVSEVAENASQEADQSGSAENQPPNPDASSGSIDPAFLEALPVELRAEVLSVQQGQGAQPQSAEPQSAGDIDPEFLAALPPDIREEVLAQQRAQRRNQSQELEGQPVEMDTVSIIATFPSDIREEVLLTSSDAILANLTPALVAEANMLRERFARRYNRSLFGMYPRNRRGEVSRRGGESLDGVGGILSRRSIGTKLVEADGSPLVVTEDLKAMVRLFRVVQPIYKGQLQRLLLNLCAHAETRVSLVKIMMDLLMLDLSQPSSSLNTIEPPYRLYGCQSHVMYSRPQYFDGVPPLVSRRLLETLTYLARNHLQVARILLEFKLHLPSIQEQENIDTRGKAIMISEDVDLEQSEGQLSLALLLGLLKHPLYMRSISHLEQLLNLLDVIIDNAESKSISSDKPSTEQQVAVAQVSSDARMSTGAGSNSSEADEAPKTLSSASGLDQEAEIIHRDLPKAELRLLCSLLAREGLSDNAYALAGNVLKKLVSIAPTHCQLFINELTCSVQSLIKSAMNELHIFENVEKAFLATASCDGAAILRVLQALSSLVSSLNRKDKGQQFLTAQEHAAVIALVWDINAALEPLWQELSSSISKIECYLDALSETSHLSISESKPSGAMPPLPAGTQTILPYIESFFVMCEKLHPGPSDLGHELTTVTTSGNMSDAEEAATTSQQRMSAPAVKVDEKHVAFVKFAERHRKLLNAFVRQNPGLLEKSFSLMLKVPRFIDFDNKRAYFRSKIKHQHDHHHSPLRISVRRAYILEDSYNQLRMRSAQDLKGRLTVHFQGEEGIDAGGLTREWYQLLSRVIFDKGALLFTTVGNESTFQPNPNSVYQTEHLSYFKFVGRVVGKALFDGQLLDVHFTRSFYKHILGVKVTYHDIEAIDPDYFKNLKWLLENDISDILDLTFSIDADEEKLILYERNEVTDYELIPNGRNIRVTEENKHQYVDLVAEHRLTTAIRPQINAFLEGFNELISRDLISIFNDKELELLISGLPDIDLDDLRANTEYSGYSVASPIIQWFWDVIQGFSKEDKARLLQFVTGTSKVPLEGFSALQGISGSQKFQIHKAYGSPEHLPSAHTCFNQLDLPEYPSKEHLEERLLLAIHEANEGFGFG